MKLPKHPILIDPNRRAKKAFAGDRIALATYYWHRQRDRAHNKLRCIPFSEEWEPSRPAEKEAMGGWVRYYMVHHAGFTKTLDMTLKCVRDSIRSNLQRRR